MTAEQWTVAKRTTALSVAGVVVLATAVLLATLSVLHRIGDDASRLARDKNELAAKAAASAFRVELDTLVSEAGVALAAAGGREGIATPASIDAWLERHPAALALAADQTAGGIPADPLPRGNASVRIRLGGAPWRLVYDAAALLSVAEAKTETVARRAFVASEAVDDTGELADSQRDDRGANAWVVERRVKTPSGADPPSDRGDGLIDEIRLAGIRGQTQTRGLVVGDDRYHAASASVPGTGLSVVLAVTVDSAWGATVLRRGRWIIVGLTVALGVWAVAFLTALGAHGALPQQGEINAGRSASEVVVSGRSGTPGEESSGEGVENSGGVVGESGPQWAVLCLAARLKNGAATTGVTLDDAPDELSKVLDSFVALGERAGLQVRGRMPDRVVLVDFGESGRVGEGAMGVATGAVRSAVDEVRANAFEVTAGVAGGSFGDDGDDDAAWGGRSLALAEALAATGRANAVLVGDGLARSLGSSFVFRDPSSYWIRGVGGVTVYRGEGRA
ncbi:MAG: hypothetical protein AAF108_00345 [Planctomycetota bacterium]